MEYASTENGGTSAPALFEEGGISASTAPSLSTRHKQMERSCLMCHQRKIRCDKRSPCSHCMKVDLLCCYPGPERASRRPHKTTISDVAARVARLERTITALSGGTAREDSNEKSILAARPVIGEVTTSETKSLGAPGDELLVKDGYSSRYINEFLLSRVLEEERELQMVMGNVSVDSSRATKSSSFDIGGIFSGFNQSMKDTQRYHPSRWHAMQLWQAFVTNVDPLAKILHIPSAQSTIFAAINNPDQVEEDLNALLFSVYFAATTSLTSTDAANLLGQPKITALNNYKQGLEQSLAEANILDTPSMISLQALTIYLTCLRVYNGGRAGWTLNGLAIRSAQSIGLHRDGKNFGLSPFESEMRRRLWWYMCASDSRAAEDHGITLNISDANSDTCYPINVDDSDLSPDMTELPKEKLKWTAMSFSLTMIETSHMLQKLYRAPAVSLSKAPSESWRDQILDGLKIRLRDAYLKHYDPNIPVQQVTILCSRLMIAKLEFLIPQKRINRSDSERKLSSATEGTLVEACRILEMNLQLQSEDLLQGFRWFFETFTQYHLLTYVLWHLSVKPIGPNVERAWNAVEKSFEIADRRDTSCNPGSKWAILQMLKNKAVRARQACDMESVITNTLLEDSSDMKTFAELGHNSDLGFGDGGDWEMSVTDFPDWNDLVGKFDMHHFVGADYSM